MSRLLGEIVEHDGYLCLRTGPSVFYPLGGNSGIASDFVDAFGPAQKGDIGKIVYRVGDMLQMENAEQLAARHRSPVNRCPGCGITIFRSSDNLNGICSGCKGMRS